MIELVTCTYFHGAQYFHLHGQIQFSEGGVRGSWAGLHFGTVVGVGDNYNFI